MPYLRRDMDSKENILKNQSTTSQAQSTIVIQQNVYPITLLIESSGTELELH